MSSEKHLLLLHGALGASAQFSHLEELLLNDFTVHRYDFPGHGGKPFAEHPMTLPLLTEHLLDHLREFHLLGCHVFGYSMGGYAALWLEANKSGCFSSIMTLGTKFNWRPEVAEKESKLIDPVFLQEKSPRYVESLTARHAPNDWKKLSAETAHMMQHLGRHALTVSDFGNISCPVRLSVGDRDVMVTLEETKEVYTALPMASLLVLPETPHLFEKADAVYLASEIKRFIL